MPGIGGGGVVNVGKPAEYYEIIDRSKANSAKEASSSSDGVAKPSSVHPNKFGKVLGAQRAINEKQVQANNSANSRVNRAQLALDKQVAKSKASVKPTRSDMNSLIKASGLTNDQVNQLMGSGAKGLAKGVNTPSKINDDKIGTNLALKKLAKEMEVQIMGMFFTLIDNARETDPEGGFGEKLFRGQYLTEIVKDSADKELGEIGLAIYRNLVKEDNIKEVRDVRK